MLICDLDGTLLQRGAVHPRNLAALSTIQSDTLTVIATGRSLFSYARLKFERLPIDYVVFSSGAGVWDCRSKKIIYQCNASRDDVAPVLAELENLDVDFFLHHPIPDNHRFFYRLTDRNSDSAKRVELYEEYGKPWTKESICPDFVAQLLISTVKERHEPIWDTMQSVAKHLSVIKATSPLNMNFIWTEIFAQGVCKSSAVEFLAEKEGIARDRTVAIGNDYNDVDLLEWAQEKFIVGNSPNELRKRFEILSDTDFVEKAHSRLGQ
jgi:HAD superfamily hydrolase (TIGR01484 family)